MKIRHPHLTSLLVFMLLSTNMLAQISSQPLQPRKDQVYAMGIPYSLPLTLVHIHIGIQKELFHTGLFAPYANKYLGIKSVIHNDSVTYQLADIRITSHLTLDTTEQYLARSEKGYDERLNRLLAPSEEGITYRKYLKQLNPTYVSTGNKNKNLLFHSTERICLTGNIKTTTDTLYKTIYKDSVFVQVPVYRENTKTKSLEERAEETAEFLINLKKAQLTLLADWETIDPPASQEVLAYAIRELRVVETDYLKQFTGGKHQQTLQQNYSIIPSSPNDTSILFHFSPDRGIHPHGDPVVCVIDKTNHTQSLTAYGQQLANQKKADYLHERIPGTARIRILYRGQIIAETQLSLFQFGTSLPMPVEFLIHSNQSYSTNP